jgi:hypothetical protein
MTHTVRMTGSFNPIQRIADIQRAFRMTERNVP